MQIGSELRIEFGQTKNDDRRDKGRQTSLNRLYELDICSSRDRPVHHDSIQRLG
jgi:hypothetical protein